MSRFILGFVCGVVVAVLLPMANEKVRLKTKQEISTPQPVVTPAPTPHWRLDSTRGTLNQPAHY